MFLPEEKDCKLKEVTKFSKAAGGAPANVAAALARIDVSAGFIGKVGAIPSLPTSAEINEF
ncbi:MAG: PfkB family carbohydrate kinase [Bacillota bacterium]